jgi:predicted transglutaminase-like cysteine proteinase
MRWSRLYSSVVAFLFVSVMPAFAALTPATPTSTSAAMPALFNTQEAFHGDNAPFKQWGEMIGRANAEFAAPAAACTARVPQCAMSEWSRLVAQIAPLPLRDKVIRVNAVLNSVPYVRTTRNWGRPMYWEAPLEFLSYGGQCQDYAIAKYIALRQAGVPAELMRLVVLRATSLGEDHAVLVVNVDGEALMLDNMRTGIIPTSDEASYRPYYSINELGWWQHTRPADTRTAQR